MIRQTHHRGYVNPAYGKRTCRSRKRRNRAANYEPVRAAPVTLFRLASTGCRHQQSNVFLARRQTRTVTGHPKAVMEMDVKRNSPIW